MFVGRGPKPRKGLSPLDPVSAEYTDVFQSNVCAAWVFANTGFLSTASPLFHDVQKNPISSEIGGEARFRKTRAHHGTSPSRRQCRWSSRR
jgi:hypothetical protein